MSSAALPPELVSLIHHVELNKVGWLDNAIRRFILATVWLNPPSLPLAELSTHIRQRFSLTLDPAVVSKNVEAPCSSGALLRLPTIIGP